MKYTLKKAADKIKGTAGDDVFEAHSAGPVRFTSDDRLDGGAGMDSLSVRLGADLVVARLKSIEQGTFWLRTTTAHLDLSKAESMSSLSLLSNTGDGANEFMISNAASVTSLTISGAQDDQFFVNGLDTGEHRSFFVAASGGQLANVDLSSATDAALKVMKVKLLGAWLNLSGDAISAQTLAISLWSRWDPSSSLDVDAGDDSGYRRVTIAGKHGSFHLTGSAVLDLESYDATRSKTLWNWADIGGNELTSVKGSNGDDILTILSLGGTGTAPALVELGTGNDDVTINFAFDAATQVFDGGDGEDTIELSGAAEDFASAAKNFENVQIDDASGLYDVGGMDLLYVTLHGATNAVTIDGLADGVELGVTGAFEHGLVINVGGAGESTTDDLHFVIYEGASVAPLPGSTSNISQASRSRPAAMPRPCGSRQSGRAMMERRWRSPVPAGWS